ncbi:MAG: molybdopterin-dependent oxidoreductase [Halomonas sp.]|uniref:molybdopterin-dependent oxidoreductase n=1 Tax=Halomonas TaxID=2745 RepID=UPI000EC52B25|nr:MULTISPECIES: molybdopterin-dependent oxidoreductase [Halomonas]HCR96305.1 oxidoreductase [Halomonas sp.]
MRTLLLGWVLLVLGSPLAGFADESTPLEAPDGAVLLEVRGNIVNVNTEEGADFDIDMLEGLPQHAFETSTPWTSGVSQYSGPLLRDVLEHVGAKGDAIEVSALNGYVADIPIKDFYDYDVILALKRNNQHIPIREFGPLWVLYPFDQDETLLSEKVRFRAVWQVRRIDVL